MVICHLLCLSVSTCYWWVCVWGWYSVFFLCAWVMSVCCCCCCCCFCLWVSKEAGSETHTHRRRHLNLRTAQLCRPLLLRTQSTAAWPTAQSLRFRFWSEVDRTEPLLFSRMIITYNINSAWRLWWWENINTATWQLLSLSRVEKHQQWPWEAIHGGIGKPSPS